MPAPNPHGSVVEVARVLPTLSLDSNCAESSMTTPLRPRRTQPLGRRSRSRLDRLREAADIHVDCLALFAPRQQIHGLEPLQRRLGQRR